MVEDIVMVVVSLCPKIW